MKEGKDLEEVGGEEGGGREERGRSEGGAREERGRSEGGARREEGGGRRADKPSTWFPPKGLVEHISAPSKKGTRFFVFFFSKEEADKCPSVQKFGGGI